MSVTAQEVDQVGPGDVIGEIGVLEKTTANADVVVTEPLLAIKVTHWEIRRLSPETLAKLQAIAAEHKGRVAAGPRRRGRLCLTTVRATESPAAADNAAGAHRSIRRRTDVST